MFDVFCSTFNKHKGTETVTGRRKDRRTDTYKQTERQAKQKQNSHILHNRFVICSLAQNTAAADLRINSINDFRATQ